MRYANIVELAIEFNKSAFKHGITEADIRWAFKTRILDKLIAGYDNTYAVIGFNVAGNPIEIMYNRIDDISINVFHAMKCRKAFREKFDL